MFAKLTGKIDTLFQDSLILDVNGVGYHVFASGKTLGMSLEIQVIQSSLLIETHVREDHIHLYGFCIRGRAGLVPSADLSSRGGGQVRPVLFLSVLSHRIVWLWRLPRTIAMRLRQAEGVGPKLAVRIVTELKDKVSALNLGNLQAEPVKKKSGAKGETPLAAF
jgi:Holliday junction DNA helicase RuvA